ncbi:MAG: hypothetical protein ACI959_002155 [Limisphaerales bacterium]|jgi:hypothetical protein
MRIILIILLSPIILFGQKAERKIIIENDTFWYITVNDETQLGTLYSGNLDKPLSEAQQLALPAGRNLTDEFNPLSWDLMEGYLFAINFLDHPLNDRIESFKRIDIAQLGKQADSEPMQLIQQSTEQFMLARNEPYADVLKRSKILKGFYFDMIIADSMIYMAISNNDELRVWRFNGERWRSGPLKTYSPKGAFSLLSVNRSVILVDESGDAFDISDGSPVNTGPKLRTHQLSDGLMIINRDKKEISFVSGEIPDSEKTMREYLASESFTVYQQEN